MLGSRQRSRDRDALQQVLGATQGMLSPVASPSLGHCPCPCPLAGLSPHAGLLWCCGQGQAPCPAHLCTAPRHSTAMLVLSTP